MPSPSVLKQLSLRSLSAIAILGFGGAPCASAQEEAEEPAYSAPSPLRTQVISLSKGWNAVWLEVEPLGETPEAVFAGTPIDIVARYFRPVTSVEFISDPLDEPYKREGWGVWYAPDRPDAFLKSLHGIQGAQGYLVHATEHFEWNVQGEVRFRRYRWKHEAFNLVGFSVDSASPPTFEELFAGSQGRVGQQIYRLTNGRWGRVADPVTARLRSGEACWVYSAGKTDYQGPLTVKIPGSGAIDFGNAGTRVEISYANTAGRPLDVAVERIGAGVSGSGAADGLPLRRVITDYSKLQNSYPTFTGQETLPNLETGYGSRVKFQLRREEMVAKSQTALLKFASGGFQVWVPIRASHPQFSAPTNP